MARHCVRRLLRGLALVLPVSAACGGEGQGPESPTSQGTTVTLKRCTLAFKHSSLLGASQYGVLEECLVKPGDHVKAGQVLGRLRDNGLRAELDLKTAQSQSDIAVRAAEVRHNLIRTQLQITAELSRRDNATREEYRMRLMDEQTATLAVEEARYNKKLAELQRLQVQAMLRDRELHSPHDGVIVEVLKVPGESVGQADPILRVVDPSEVRVMGELDVSAAWQVKAGQPVSVWPEIPGVDLAIENEVFTGQVEHVDLQIQPESQTCRFTAIVANQNERLRAGLEARVEIQTDSNGVQTATNP